MTQPDSPHCKGCDILGLNKNELESIPEILVDISDSQDLVVITGQSNLTKMLKIKILYS